MLFTFYIISSVSDHKDDKELKRSNLEILANHKCVNILTKTPNDIPTNVIF